MRRTGSTLALSMTAALFLYLLADAGQVRQAAEEALKLCAGSVIPALFPFLAVSGLLVSLGFGAWAAPVFSGLMTPLFRLPGQAGGALALGLLGGYPVGAKAAAELYRARQLTRDEARRLLAFCNHASPAFLVSVLGIGVFGSVRTGVWLLLVHLLSALLTGLLFRGKDRDGGAAAGGGASDSAGEAVPPSKTVPSSRKDGVPDRIVPPTPLFPALVEAVGGAGAAMVRICAFTVFFSTLSAPLRRMGGAWAVSSGLLDLFSLTPCLTPDRTGFVLASVLTAFGGLGVLCQTAAVVEGSGLGIGSCAAGKAVQGVLAGLLAALVSLMVF